MTVLKIIAVLALLSFIVWSAMAINEYADKKYSYRPFSMGNTIAMIASILMFVIAFFLTPKGHSFQEILTSAINFKVTEESSNTVVLVVLSLIVTAVVYISMILQSNFFIATYAIAIQFAAAWAVIAVIVLAAFGSEPKKRRRR